MDYNDELDVLVSGSADFTVKVWALSAGACLNTLTGHTEWVTKVSSVLVFDWSSILKNLMCFEMCILLLSAPQVILQKSEVESMVHSPGDYILLSADKYEIKVILVFSILKSKETE